LLFKFPELLGDGVTPPDELPLVGDGVIPPDDPPLDEGVGGDDPNGKGLGDGQQSTAQFPHVSNWLHIPSPQYAANEKLYVTAHAVVPKHSNFIFTT